MAVVTEKFANNAASTLNGGIDNVVTSLVVNSATSFPNAGQFRILIESEILLVTGVSGAIFTVTRGYENTTPASHANSTAVTHIVTAGSLVNNPRSMTASGDIEYLNSTGAVTRLAAPVDGSYGVQFTSNVPAWATIAGLPSGVVVPFAGSAAPTGYLLCDGSAVSRTTYSGLFTTIGVTYGSGDGATTFNVPDLRQRFPLGKAVSGTGSTLGSTGGAIDHTHTSAAHSHTFTGSAGTTGTTDIGHIHGLPSGAGHTVIVASGIDFGVLDNGYGTLTTGGMSANNPHSHAFTPAGTVNSATPGATGTNNPPYVTFNYIIKT